MSKPAVVLFALAVSAQLVCSAAPHFVTPAMIRRNGLTDEQYEQLWSMGRHPRIDPSAAREWIFHSSRGKNIEGWLDEIGKTNDFARLVIPTMETNKLLKAEVSRLNRSYQQLTNTVAHLFVRIDSLNHEVATLKEENWILEQKYAEAKPAAAITRRIQDALVAEGTLAPYLRKELVALRDRTTDPKKIEVFDACIALMDSVINAPRDTDMEASK